MKNTGTSASLALAFAALSRIAAAQEAAPAPTPAPAAPATLAAAPSPANNADTVVYVVLPPAGPAPEPPVAPETHFEFYGVADVFLQYVPGQPLALGSSGDRPSRAGVSVTTTNPVSWLDKAGLQLELAIAPDTGASLNNTNNTGTAVPTCTVTGLSEAAQCRLNLPSEGTAFTASRSLFVWFSKGPLTLTVGRQPSLNGVMQTTLYKRAGAGGSAPMATIPLAYVGPTGLRVSYAATLQLAVPKEAAGLDWNVYVQGAKGPQEGEDGRVLASRVTASRGGFEASAGIEHVDALTGDVDVVSGYAAYEQPISEWIHHPWIDSVGVLVFGQRLSVGDPQVDLAKSERINSVVAALSVSSGPATLIASVGDIEREFKGDTRMFAGGLRVQGGPLMWYLWVSDTVNGGSGTYGASQVPFFAPKVVSGGDEVGARTGLIYTWGKPAR